MSFKILLLAADVDPSWPEKIRRAVPGVVVKAFVDPKDAAEDIVDADAAYGTVPPELLARATKLRWICAARAGLGGAWFYDELVKGDVIVTNMRGSYNEHLAGHAVAFLLAFARRFDHYLPQKRWLRGPGNDRSSGEDSTDRRGWRRRRRSIEALRCARHARARH
jgi:phosphoglycerate dehydrogenase-like enzyme